MGVQGILSVTLEVPDLEAGLEFYGNGGLVYTREGDHARLRCLGQDKASIVLLGGAPRKRLHHLSLRADDLGAIAGAVAAHGGQAVEAPTEMDPEGLWIQDPNGMLLHLTEADAEPALEESPPFVMNMPGKIIRKCKSAMQPRAIYGNPSPLRLGHVLVFSPNVPRSVDFFTQALGMGLADRAQDVIAFCCARANSDHHVVAFASSPGIGFHHASFQARDPDDVGRWGRVLADHAGRGEWGVGRHTIGSNFFHYIQDPWGSWMEYYADMDYINDYALWTPTNYAMEDSLANWGPPVPHDFVHNYEIGEAYRSIA